MEISEAGRGLRRGDGGTGVGPAWSILDLGSQ